MSCRLVLEGGVIDVEEDAATVVDELSDTVLGFVELTPVNWPETALLLRPSAIVGVLEAR